MRQRTLNELALNELAARLAVRKILRIRKMLILSDEFSFQSESL